MSSSGDIHVERIGRVRHRGAIYRATVTTPYYTITRSGGTAARAVRRAGRALRRVERHYSRYHS